MCVSVCLSVCLCCGGAERIYFFDHIQRHTRSPLDKHSAVARAASHSIVRSLCSARRPCETDTCAQKAAPAACCMLRRDSRLASREPHAKVSPVARARVANEAAAESAPESAPRRRSATRARMQSFAHARAAALVRVRCAAATAAPTGFARASPNSARVRARHAHLRGVGARPRWRSRAPLVSAHAPTTRVSVCVRACVCARLRAGKNTTIAEKPLPQAQLTGKKERTNDVWKIM